MVKIDELHEIFKNYYDNAKHAYEQGDYASAKRYYMLAAEQMLLMAKESVGDQQKKRYDRAKNLLKVADSIPLPQKPEKEEPAPQPSEPQAPQTPQAPQKVVPDSDKITLEEALRRLSELQGLAEVKSSIVDWVDQLKGIEMRKERGLAVPEMPCHVMFTGNPGTGKKTVARIVAQIYCALGILSDGQFVKVNRSDLVSDYVGLSKVRTEEALQRAKGGVLYVDNAYSLVEGGANDNGREALDAIVKEMEQDNIAVIFAGYEAPMQLFVSANPSLRSRFGTTVHFADYNGDDMLNIFLRLCRQNQYTPNEAAQSALHNYFEQLYLNRDVNFGNGKTVRELFGTVVLRQSKRVAHLNAPTDSDVATIIPDDLPFVTFETTSQPASQPVLQSFAPYGEATPPAPQPQQPAETPSDEASIAAKLLAEDKKAPKQEEKADPTPEDKIMEEGGAVNTEFRFDWDNLPIINFDDIAGLENVKEVVRVKVLLPLEHPEVFEGYVRKGGGGLLLYGPPGTGKTMIAAAIANEINAKFCSVKPSDLLNQGAGNTEKAVRSLFAQARQFPCAVIYFDEMDSISPKSTKSQYAKQLRSELLAQLQGIEEYGNKKDNILFLIAATNKPWDIDSAFVRPGRFGTRIYVGLPDEPAREYMLNRRLEKIRLKGVVKIAEDVNVPQIVAATNGFNGADMTNLLDRMEEISALRGISAGEKSITQADFDKALEEITPSVQKEDIEKLLEWKAANG